MISKNIGNLYNFRWHWRHTSRDLFLKAIEPSFPYDLNATIPLRGWITIEGWDASLQDSIILLCTIYHILHKHSVLGEINVFV